MKKTAVLIAAFLLLLCCAGCQPPSTAPDTEDPFANYSISQRARDSYDYSFNQYYTPEEYVNLTTTLPTLLDDASVEPVYAISDSLFLVIRTIDRYDLSESSIAVVDGEGNIITDWNSTWSVTDIWHNAKCGDYLFIETESLGYGDCQCDVVNKEGKVLTTVTCKSARYDLGEGYVFFSKGQDFGNIMNSKGEVIELEYASVMPGYGSKTDGSLGDDEAIGKISEGLFYGFGKGNVNTVAYYYNTQGKVVIDLSTRVVNFEVTKLSDFSNGQARIEFIGANYKTYYGYIDKTGAFVEEPTLCE